VSNLPLGIIDPTPYVQFAVPLEPGDLVVFYTDALIETRDRKGEPLGTSGLLDLVRSLDVCAFETLSSSIRNALESLRDGEDSDDDLTVLVLHHNAADPPRLSIGERLRVIGRMMGVGRIEPRL
jgi:serine phosphatase RsbU (regulator of sigma subunit)